MKDGDTIALLGDLEAAEGGFRIVRARIAQGAQGFTLASSEPISSPPRGEPARAGSAAGAGSAVPEAGDPGLRGARRPHRPDGGRGRPPPRLAEPRAFPRPAGGHQPHPRPELDRDGDPRRARAGGMAGLVVAGVCFIAPASLIVLACAWAYMRYGTLPAAEGLLHGVKPVIIAIVLQALWGLGRTAARTRPLAALGLLSLAAAAAGGHELAVIFGAGSIAALVAGRASGPDAASPTASSPWPWARRACRDDGRRGALQPDLPLPRLPEDRLGALRQRLRAAGLPARRPRRAARLADRGPAPRRHRRGPGHAGPGLHHRHLHRLRPRRPRGRRRRHGGDLPARLSSSWP